MGVVSDGMHGQGIILTQLPVGGPKVAGFLGGHGLSYCTAWVEQSPKDGDVAGA